jgi:hypothetical protein
MQIAREPNVTPDYRDIIIPPNIAPLNFRVQEQGQAFRVKIHSEQGSPVTIRSKTDRILIPLKPWRALLLANRGRDLFVEVSVKDKDHVWRQYQRMTHHIAREDIDGTLVYRFMKPIYKWWKDIGIYQRDLAGFDESLILHGRSFGKGCVNCHSFTGQASSPMTLGLRSKTYGSDTLLVHNEQVRKIGAKWGYTAWHPSGQFAVYSMNKVRQFTHAGGMEVRDVVDLDSALACYDIDTQKVTCPAPLAQKDRLETYPAWSPDGKTLYFCSGPVLWKDRETVPPEHYDELQYDLKRVSYSRETRQWGPAETVLSAETTGLSILLPRVSPDGRFLLFCMCQYGCFPVYQPSSDLYLMDLASGEYHKLGINSDYSESWHSWSSNSRWIAFSSKRQGGSLTRTHLCYVDELGQTHKAFVLPQEDPALYESQLEIYSVPELVREPVTVSRSKLARAARASSAIPVDIPITGATPKATSSEPWQERE